MNRGLRAGVAIALAASVAGAAGSARAQDKAAPQAKTAEAVVSARGLDGLIQQLRGDKHMGRLLTALLLCKALGAPQPDGSVEYRIVVGDGRASVNGTDITPMVAR